VTSGTIAGLLDFHLVVNYSYPEIEDVGVSSVDIVEQTDAHEPWHYHSDVLMDGLMWGDTYSAPPPPDVCTDPPMKYQLWKVFPIPTSQPPCSFHNTSYVVTVNYWYRLFVGPPPDPPGDPYRMITGSISRTFNFQNLIVEAQPKILKWDPDVPENCDTTFSYTLSSAQKKNCNVTIKIYSTEGNLVYQTNLTQLCPGTYTFTWDGTNNQPSPGDYFFTWDGTNNQLPPSAPSNIAPAGLYTFDIQVQGACPYDQDRMRSSLTIGNHDVVMVENGKYRVSYVLQDSKDASQAGVDVYDFNLQKMTGITDGTAKSPTVNTADISLQIDAGGTYRFVFWAIDDHPETDKAHRRKPALEVNQGTPIPTAANCWAKDANTKEAAKKATDAQHKVQYYDSGKNILTFGEYGPWKYYDTFLGIHFWNKEPQTLKVSSALDLIRPLRRVAVFSWYLHDLGGGSDGGVIAFKDDCIVPTRSYLQKLMNKGFQITTDDTGAVYLKKGRNGPYKVYFIEDLDGLSHITCALLINCSSEEGEGSKEMVDAFAHQNANFAGTIYGGPISPKMVNGGLGRKGISQVFWESAAEGESLLTALNSALEYLKSNWISGDSPTFAPTGAPEYKAYGVYRLSGAPDPYGNSGAYLGPPRGGKKEDELIIMGNIP